jgi:hypothetical protein
VNGRPLVTVIGATRNVRAVTHLTYASFRRFTPEPVVVLVADNGSTDGTLEDMRLLNWLRVYSLADRRLDMEAKAERARILLKRVDDALDDLSASISEPERHILQKMRRKANVVVPTLEEMRHHAPALNWLASHVETRYFLLLDSDVEFLQPGWLSELIAIAEQEDLGAIGEYEPGQYPCMPRLATYLLLIRTDTFRSLKTSFSSELRFSDDHERQRWYSQQHDDVLAASAFDGYSSAAFYDTAALLFEGIVRRGIAWRPFPATTAAKFRHFGHMTWSEDAKDGYQGLDAIRAHVRAMNEYAVARLNLEYGATWAG